MIRHTSVGVPKGTCYGWTDVPVADTFEQEAAETKRNLESMLDNNKLDIVFSSPLTRARKLAAFCGYDNPVTDDRLKEMNMGDWEMMRYTASARLPARGNLRSWRCSHLCRSLCPPLPREWLFQPSHSIRRNTGDRIIMPGPWVTNSSEHLAAW